MMIDKRLVNLVPESKKYVFLTVLLRFCSLLSGTAFIFCVAHVLKNKNWQLSSILIIIFCLLLSVAANLLSSRTSFHASSKVKIKLRTLIYEKLLSLGTDYQESSSTAKIIQTATEGVEQIETWFSAFLPQFYYAMIAALFTFCVIAFFNLKMALVLLGCVPMIPLSMALVQGIAKKILGKYWAQYANLADNFLENLEGLTTLQIYEADGFKAAQMAREAETFRRVTMKVLSMQLNSIIIMDVVAYGGAALGICMAFSSFYSGSMDFFSAFACILLSADFFIPLRRLGSAFHVAMNGVTASKNIFELLDTNELGMCNDKGESLPLAPTAKAFSATPSAGDTPATPPVFSAENLSVSFGERVALKNCSLSIDTGSFVAFVGKSGSGKSTLAKILSGIYGSYSGSAKISGMEIKNISKKELHSFVTYISHRDWIFAGTVRDCLLEGKPSATDKRLWESLEKVNLSDFVRENGGLEMLLREGGSNLSGGQKQRLSIARALLHDSPVMIFDEATSNIDVESECAILNLIRSLKGQKTLIMISHRKENSLGADKIFEFENGTLIEPVEMTSGAAL
ncbi:MAG: ABC transporter ATP-binding protein/permease [Treponema sp.]|uniref:ABC transporter ATP-binding protein/permease n=1 Tax=Treponema sp. TaxID=166 RepID=UPI002A9087C9|nr:ABC transporter ATP-binding protein/permease [Treponema sp.]MDY6397099.1 ABC transporter ATP-binding protein/permease [Treponema sp.]